MTQSTLMSVSQWCLTDTVNAWTDVHKAAASGPITEPLTYRSRESDELAIVLQVNAGQADRLEGSCPA